MGWIFLTLVIAVLNLCLGYALAVQLGYGTPSLLDAWEILVADRSQRGPTVAPALLTDAEIAGLARQMDSVPAAGSAEEPAGEPNTSNDL